MDVTWDAVSGLVQTSALAALAVLLATGTLIPRLIVEKLILAPLHSRIEALERVSARRDEQQTELQQRQAEAIAAQGRAMEVLLAAVDGKGRRGQ